jgi:hypothetical protein
VTVMLEPSAILNKLLAARGRSGFASPADMARALFHGSTTITTALQVIAALALLGALGATLAGVLQIIRGARGGIDLALSGVYGLLGLIVALAVVM